mgnify:CR=1 FL=1
MNKETLEALKGSIKKWERIVKTTTAKDDGIYNCSLCKLFYALISKNFLSESCHACPIYSKTNQCFCYATPYSAWVDHQRVEHFDNTTEVNHRHHEKGCKECLQISKDELNFLKSLLPKNDKKVIL